MKKFLKVVKTVALIPVKIAVGILAAQKFGD